MPVIIGKKLGMTSVFDKKGNFIPVTLVKIEDGLLNLESFKDINEVKVEGYSKGKGFQGVTKRFNFACGPGGHGHKYQRSPGSIGTRKPRRTHKGKKLPGRMGGDKITLKNKPIIDLDFENNIMAIRGPLPGSIKTTLFISPA